MRVCDFCLKHEYEVETMAEERHDKRHVAICDQCVTLCVEIIEQNRLKKEPSHERVGER